MQSPKLCTLVGHVTKGRGLAKDIFALESIPGGLPDGGLFYPGSLNVVLDGPVRFDVGKAIPFAGGKRYLWPVSLNGVGSPVFVYRWKGCPLHVLEIVSPLRLRDCLALDDGAVLEVVLSCDQIRRVGHMANFAWYLLWWRRESWYYIRDRYKRLVYLSRLNRFCSQ